ncbi:MAG: tetratricopeptide repeat protein [Armatimonadetes bacterium]|nr:tetratricopeptide repeat protein [Armatimonadota bacterium]
MVLALRILPKPSDLFVGREKELEKLDSSFTGRRILFLEGIEGIGKTSLGLAFANSLEGKSPGKVFWIPCQEGWQVESLLKEILNWLPNQARESFEDWGKEGPPGVQERFVYLIHLLNREGVTVFVDDLHLVDGTNLPQILSSLKMYLRESKFFFITRERPNLSPMEMLDLLEVKLEGLSSSEGLALFESLLQTDESRAASSRDILEKVVRKLVGHPLLIKTFAALMLEGLGEPGELLSDLPDFFQEMERNLFHRIREGLSNGENELLGLFSVSRVPLHRDLLGDQKLREGLEKRFLLARDEKGRFSVHSLIREFTLRGLGQEERLSLHQRLAEHFHGYLKKATGDSELAREALYHYLEANRQQEARNLLLLFGGKLCSQGYYEEVLRFAAALGTSDPKLLVMRANVLSILGRWEQATEILKQMEGTLKDESLLAEVLSSLAGAYLNMGKLGDSLEHYEKALSIFKDTNNLKGALKVLNYMTFIYGFRSQREKALSCGEEAVKYARDLKDEAGLAHSLRMRGVVLLDSGRFAEALEVSRECLEKAKAIASMRLTCWALINLSTALLGLGRTEEAREVVNESLEKGSTSFDTQILGFSHMTLARVHWEEGNLEEGLDELERARTSFASQGNTLGESIAKYHIALVLQQSGKNKEAEDMFRETMETAIKAQHFGMEIKSRESLASLYLIRSRPKEAVELAEKNLQDLAEVQREESRGEAYLILAEASWRLHETEKAEEYLKLATETGRKEAADFLTARVLYLASKISGAKAQTKVAHQEEAHSLLQRLTGSRQRLVQGYFDRIDLLTEERYFIKTKEGERLADKEEVGKVRAGRKGFSLFIDLPQKTVWEKEKGDINILGKRILSTLLIFLVKNAGKGFTNEDVFTSVWGYKYDSLVSAGEVRKNVSRLRDLIEPDRKSWKYIKLSEGLMKEKGKYSFDKSQDFCIIEEVRE